MSRVGFLSEHRGAGRQSLRVRCQSHSGRHVQAGLDGGSQKLTLLVARPNDILDVSQREYARQRPPVTPAADRLPSPVG